MCRSGSDVLPYCYYTLFTRLPLFHDGDLSVQSMQSRKLITVDEWKTDAYQTTPVYILYAL